LHRGPLDCLRSGQADQPWINRRYPKERRFLLKRVDVIPLPFYVDASPKDATRRLHPIISRGSPENREIQVLRDKPVELIK